MERENFSEKRNFLRDISNLADKVKLLPESEREGALITINKAQVAIENIMDFAESIGSSNYESMCEMIFIDTASQIEHIDVADYQKAA
ncbi:MAG: hypothetical protein KBF62_02700 [Candidatus Pacebacteria bacterium]|nr:hypothetical protein [Candidatus Paceibacterota bacterium]MBP9058522.1 hypothetical protein [Candidatus Paceibacterota bacterium]MBP9770022.1 hypothetical protein [Candidatus Paceibacterota bacterium]